MGFFPLKALSALKVFTIRHLHVPAQLPSRCTPGASDAGWLFSKMSRDLLAFLLQDPPQPLLPQFSSEEQHLGSGW